MIKVGIFHSSCNLWLHLGPTDFLHHVKVGFGRLKLVSGLCCHVQVSQVLLVTTPEESNSAKSCCAQECHIQPLQQWPVVVGLFFDPTHQHLDQCQPQILNSLDHTICCSL